MSFIDNYIDIKITRATLGVTSSSLSTLLIIGDSKKTRTLAQLPRVKSYGSLEAVSTDYATADKEYIAASAYFGQDIKPSQLLIGRVVDAETFADIVNVYKEIKLENNDFYGVAITNKDTANQMELVSFIETDNKIFGISSNDPKILDSADTTNIAYKLKSVNSLRSYVIYNTSADTKYPECAWFGKMFSKLAGSATWAYKSLSGVNSDKLTDDNVTKLQTNNCNYCVTVAGVPAMFDGLSGNGTFLDATQGIDWLSANMQAKIANALLTSDKIPMTNAGIGIIESMVRAALNEAVTIGIIAQESIVVTAPDVLSISPSDRANRKINMSFEARLAGAIHKIGIKGTISI